MMNNFNTHFFNAEKVTHLREIHKLSPDDLKKECSTEDIGRVANFISWKVVGPHLPEMSSKDIEFINNNRFFLRKREKCLEIWKQRNGADATYHALILGMLKAEKRDEAELVCKVLKECKCRSRNRYYLQY